MKSNAASITEDDQYLSFTLGGEEYGVDILKVQEIRGWETVRALPDMPSYVKGVLDLRGTIVPIIDLRMRFDIDNYEYTTTTVIIVLSVYSSSEESGMVGVVVDSVSDVLSLDSNDIKPAPHFNAAIENCYIKGVVSNDHGMVVLLDSDKLLDEIDV